MPCPGAERPRAPLSAQPACAFWRGGPAGSGTVYVITGGGGGFLYDWQPHPLAAFGLTALHYLRGRIEGTRLTLSAIDSTGVEFDQVVIAPAPRLDRITCAADAESALAPGLSRGRAPVGTFPATTPPD